MDLNSYGCSTDGNFTAIHVASPVAAKTAAPIAVPTPIIAPKFLKFFLSFFIIFSPFYTVISLSTNYCGGSLKISSTLHFKVLEFLMQEQWNLDKLH